MKKALICDASSLIALTNTCLLNTLSFLNKKRYIDFIIPPTVKDEIINKPLSIKMKAYELSAINMKKALKQGVIIETKVEDEMDYKEIMDIANHIFFSNGKPIHLIDRGEADMIVLAHALDTPNLLMDERTTRMLIESPFRLKEHLEDELKTNVFYNRDNLERFKDYTKDMKVIRSVEIATIAYKLGYFEMYEDEKAAYNAALYALKYAGCAVRFDEIDILKDVKK